MKFNLGTAVLATAVAGLSSSAALAVPAMVETGSNFRAGPGTNYRVIAQIRAGEVIDVQDCNGGWCAASYGARQGYIARSLIDFGQASGGYRVSPGYAVPAPTFGFSYGYYDRPHWRHWRHAPSYGYYGPGYGPGVSFGFGFDLD